VWWHLDTQSACCAHDAVGASLPTAAKPGGRGEMTGYTGTHHSAQVSTILPKYTCVYSSIVNIS
jgi:hypothetical protein